MSTTQRQLRRRTATNAIRTLGIAAAGAVLAGGLVLAAGAGTAAADGHNIVDPDATWGVPDGPHQRGNSLRRADHTVDRSENTPNSWPTGSSWRHGPIWDEDGFQTYDTSSYPESPSWPGDGWGVPDN